MDKCTVRNNVYRLSEIQEESVNTVQNSQENTLMNFNKGGGVYQFNRKRVKSQNAGSNDCVVQQQSQILGNEEDSCKYVEIIAPNQNAHKRPQIKRTKQVPIYDQVRNTIIKNIYCSNQQEQFFKQYIQQQFAIAQQQQQMQLFQAQQMSIQQEQQEQILDNSSENNKSLSILVNSGQERLNTVPSNPYTASTSASTTQNSYNSKKQQNSNSIHSQHQFLPYAKKTEQTQNQCNSNSFHVQGNNSTYKSSPLQSQINSQTIIRNKQCDNLNQSQLTSKINSKYVEKFQSATVYMGRGAPIKTNIKHEHLPPVQCKTKKSFENIENSQDIFQLNIQTKQLGNNQIQSISKDIFSDTLRLYQQRSVNNINDNQSNVISQEKPQIENKEKEDLSQYLTQSLKQKSIIQKQKQQLQQYNTLLQQNQQLEKENLILTNIYNKPQENVKTNKTLTNQIRLEQIQPQKTNDLKINQNVKNESENDCTESISKKQFEKFLLQKQRLIDEKINSLQVTEIEKVEELRQQLEKQKGNIKQSSTSVSFYEQKEKQTNVQRTHSSNVNQKTSNINQYTSNVNKYPSTNRYNNRQNQQDDSLDISSNSFDIQNNRINIKDNNYQKFNNHPLKNIINTQSKTINSLNNNSRVQNNINLSNLQVKNVKNLNNCLNNSINISKLNNQNDSYLDFDKLVKSSVSPKTLLPLKQIPIIQNLN